MEKVKIVTLENDKKCIILDEFKFNEKEYVVLASIFNGNDLAIRKVKGEYLIGLDDEFEFDQVISFYMTKKENSD